MADRPRQSRHVGLSFALGAALLLRAVVPAGYMPAPLTDGWMLQLCPDGLPAATVQALLGADHRHHHHHHGAHLDTPASGTAPDDAAVAVPAQCELGGFAMVASVGAAGLPHTAIEGRSGPRRNALEAPAERTSRGFQPRAPPHLLS